MKKIYILENGAEVNKNDIKEKYCYTCKYNHLPKKDCTNHSYVCHSISKNYCYKCKNKNRYIQSEIIYRSEENG